jgi:diadenosine tetraphosphate (Ap4A) HIT family hydrolase
MNQDKECLTCKSLRGEITLSPGPVIYTGKYWQIEHVAPTAVKGWLVIILKRHALALHELSEEEFLELGILTKASTKILFQAFHCEKEYMACFAEGEGFQHIHVHIIAKPENLSLENFGPNIFQLLGPKTINPLENSVIAKICSELKELFQQEL